jgi:hypothetical protein
MPCLAGTTSSYLPGGGDEMLWVALVVPPFLVYQVSQDDIFIYTDIVSGCLLFVKWFYSNFRISEISPSPYQKHLQKMPSSVIVKL